MLLWESDLFVGRNEGHPLGQNPQVPCPHPVGSNTDKHKDEQLCPLQGNPVVTSGQSKSRERT